MRNSLKQRRSPRSTTAIQALVILDPDAARARILREVDRSRGRVRSAAIPLGGNRRTLERIIFHLDIWPDVEAIRARWAQRRRDPLGLSQLETAPCPTAIQTSAY